MVLSWRNLTSPSVVDNLLQFIGHALEHLGVLFRDVFLFPDVLAQVEQGVAGSRSVGELVGHHDVSLSL